MSSSRESDGPSEIPVSPGCFSGLSNLRLPPGYSLYRGKVRDVVISDTELLILTTDRVSAFDRVLATVRDKGEVLNRISVFWLRKAESIMRTHLVEEISPRTVRVIRTEPLPVEVVVRAYLTGSAWRDYRDGRPVSGIEPPPGMRKDEKFETPVITPSTKEQAGAHDRPVSRDEILESGVVQPELWIRIEQAALELFRMGSEHAFSRGLILVDTKYEFGLDRNGELVLIDEIHTPDSSRYWFSREYDRRFREGSPQHALDKEYLRQWLLDHGFSGEGPPPEIPEQVLSELSRRYRETFSILTGEKFTALAGDSQAEQAVLQSMLHEDQDGPTG